MARVVITVLADADTEAIFDDLAATAGRRVHGRRRISGAMLADDDSA